MRFSFYNEQKCWLIGCKSPYFLPLTESRPLAPSSSLRQHEPVRNSVNEHCLGKQIYKLKYAPYNIVQWNFPTICLLSWYNTFCHMKLLICVIYLLIFFTVSRFGVSLGEARVLKNILSHVFLFVIFYNYLIKHSGIYFCMQCGRTVTLFDGQLSHTIFSP